MGFDGTVTLLNKGHFYCQAFVATTEGWPLLRGFNELKITELFSCSLALIQGLALVQGGTIQGLALVQGGTIQGFHCTFVMLSDIKMMKICCSWCV